MSELSAFEWYLKSLPHEVREEAIKTDEYLMKNMKSALKFKRTIDKDGKLSYISPCGFKYSMLRYEIGEPHVLSWIKYWNKDLQQIIWPGNFDVILNKIAESSPEFANKMFANIHRHIGGVGCKKCAESKCENMASIEYNGEVKQACGGSMQFKWHPPEFEDVRNVVAVVAECKELFSW